MSAISPDTIMEPRWITYSKAIAFTSPAVIAWGFACVLLAPKVHEIVNNAALDPSKFGWLWPATFFAVQYGRSMLVAAILMLLLLEFVAPWWRRRRQVALGVGIWLANVTVLFGLTMLLVMVLVAAPSLARH